MDTLWPLYSNSNICRVMYIGPIYMISRRSIIEDYSGQDPYLRYIHHRGDSSVHGTVDHLLYEKSQYVCCVKLPLHGK